MKFPSSIHTEKFPVFCHTSLANKENAGTQGNADTMASRDRGNSGTATVRLQPRQGGGLVHTPATAAGREARRQRRAGPDRT